MTDQASAIGVVIFGLAALLGVGGGAVGLFVLRVEFIQERREREALARRIESLEDRCRELED